MLGEQVLRSQLTSGIIPCIKLPPICSAALLQLLDVDRVMQQPSAAQLWTLHRQADPHSSDATPQADAQANPFQCTLNQYNRI